MYKRRVLPYVQDDAYDVNNEYHLLIIHSDDPILRLLLYALGFLKFTFKQEKKNQLLFFKIFCKV